MMEKPTCGTCAYWEESYEDQRAVLVIVGFCCRYPPVLDCQPDDVDRGGKACFDDQAYKQPFTRGSTWCGEHPDFPEWLAATRRAPAKEGDDPRKRHGFDTERPAG